MGELNDKLSDASGRKIVAGGDFLTKPSCYLPAGESRGSAESSANSVNPVRTIPG